jgi:dihydroorotate dehydrogenase
MILDLALPALRALPPEAAHTLTIDALALGLPPGKVAIPPGIGVTLPVSGLRLPSPVGLAAGFDKDARAFPTLLRLGFGFVECGTVTPRPQAGNPKPRVFRLPQHRAVINRMGFNNGGLEGFVTRIAARTPQGGVLGANVGANKDSSDRIADYVSGVQAVHDHCDYITLNISSPNTPGLRGLQDKASLTELLARTATATEGKTHRRPVFLKIAPDLDEAALDDIAAIALAAPWLQGLIVSNTTLARPPELRGPHREEAGGLSGQPLFQRSTDVLKGVAARVGGKLDLIAAGGVSSAGDVITKLDAGAQAVQLYTALVYEGPGLIARINRDLARRAVHSAA